MPDVVIVEAADAGVSATTAAAETTEEAND